MIATRGTKLGVRNRLRERPAAPASRLAVAAPTTTPGTTPTRPLRSARPSVRRPVRASFDAAQTNDDNRRHWAAADDFSAAAANSPGVRRVLRRRSRYEVGSNSYAKGIVKTLANDLIGRGPRLQVLLADARANRLVESRFSAWAQAVLLARKLRTMSMAKTGDGEVFGFHVNNPRLLTPVQLDLRLIEGDQVATPELDTLTDPLAVDGIEFDTAGNPVAYHLLKYHPGDLFYGGSIQYDAIDARSVVHWFAADRPGQRRGIPDITPALPLYAQLRRYTLAVLASAETAADFTALLQADSPAGDEDQDNAVPFEALEIERRMMTTLPAGWKLAQLKAEQPTTTYAMFKRELLTEIARCLNVPYNVASGDSSAYNYASGRLDHQVYDAMIRVERSEVESVILDPTFATWCREAALADPDLEEALADGPPPHQWFWDGKGHVDPMKEAAAQEIRLRNHTSTLADEYARQGYDWEEKLEQRAREMARMRKLGLAVPLAPGTTPGGDLPPGAPRPEEEPVEDDE